MLTSLIMLFVMVSMVTFSIWYAQPSKPQIKNEDIPQPPEELMKKNVRKPKDSKKVTKKVTKRKTK